jgi:hypothetical protein
MRHVKIFLLSALMTLVSCAGYRYSQTNNPLLQYGVESLSIPMFYNFSALPEVSSSFTRETFKLLSGFSGLKIQSGLSANSDAVLIGIVRSEDKISDVLRSENLRVAQGAASNAIGNDRPEFSIPGATAVSLRLQVIVIKKPTPDELKLLQSEMGEKIPAQGKILFNEVFNIRQSFIREVFDGESVSVVGSQNSGALRRTKDQMAVNAAQQIRDMILYAF